MDDLRERLEAALQLVHDLAQGKRSWTLSVPARPDYDPDLVLSSVLSEALDHPERLMGEPVAYGMECDGDPRGAAYGKRVVAGCWTSLKRAQTKRGSSGYVGVNAKIVPLFAPKEAKP